MRQVPQPCPLHFLLLLAASLSLGSLSPCLAQQQLGRVAEFERAEGLWPPPASSQPGRSPTEGGSRAVSSGGGGRRRGDGGEGGTEAHKIESADTAKGGYGGFLVPRQQGTNVCSPHPPTPPRPHQGVWRPSPGKYLLAYCYRFGISNRLFCLQHYILLASLMNRTLILLPSHPCERDFPKRATTKSLVDVPRFRECLMRVNVANLSAYFNNSEAMPGEGPTGENATLHGPSGENGTLLAVHQRVARDQGTGLWAVTFAEFLELKGRPKDALRVDVPWSSHPPRVECNAGGAFAFVRRGLDPPWTPERDRKYPYRHEVNATWARRMEEAAAPFDVITLGDAFYLHVLPFDFIEPTPLGPAFHSPCTLLLQPEKYVISAAAEFWRAKLGGRPYGAMHLRLNEEYHRLTQRRGWPFFTLKESIACTLPKILDSGVKQVFVATDSPGLMGTLEETLRQHGIRVVLYNSTGEPLHSLEDNLLVEKLVCAGSSIFFSSPFSTFSMHIRLLRSGFAMNSCEDEPICRERFDMVKMR